VQLVLIFQISWSGWRNRCLSIKFWLVCWSEATNAYLSNFIGQKAGQGANRCQIIIGQISWCSNKCLFIKLLVMVLVIMQQMLHTQIFGNLAGNGAINANKFLWY
jgi:hypothetical protein